MLSDFDILMKKKHHFINMISYTHLHTYIFNVHMYNHVYTLIYKHACTDLCTYTHRYNIHKYTHDYKCIYLNIQFSFDVKLFEKILFVISPSNY